MRDIILQRLCLKCYHQLLSENVKLTMNQLASAFYEGYGHSQWKRDPKTSVLATDDNEWYSHDD